MTSAQKTLRVICIIVVIFAIIDIILGLFSMLGGGIIGAASSTTEGAAELAANGVSAEEGAYAGMAVMLAGFVIIISGVIDLIVGILGMRGAKDPAKIGPFRIICIIGVVLGVIGIIGTLCGGNAGSSIVSSIISVVLMIWCLYLANKIKDQGAPLE